MASNVTLSDYLTLFRRRIGYFLIPFLLLFGASVAVATLLPPKYQATATIQIEKRELPRELIDTTVVTGYVDEYLEILGQQILSDENLLRIVRELNLYPALLENNGRGAVLKEMRGNLRRQTVYVEVGPEEQRSNNSIAVAFNVGYQASDPHVARDVANALAELYLTESERRRTEQAAQFSGFLEEQSERLAQRVTELEEELAAFKEKHFGSLPEFSDLNLRMMETMEDQLNRHDETINSLRQRQIQLQGELAQLEPYVQRAATDPNLMSPAQQLEHFRMEYLRLSASYSPNHPDLVRLRNRLSALEGQTPKSSQVYELVRSAEQYRKELLAARQRYSPEHPDVKRLERRVGELRSQISGLGGQTPEESASHADNPAYISVNSQLQGVQAEIEAETAKREQVRERLEKYQQRMLSAPEVEKQYRGLMREYEHAQQEYRETRDKLLKAEVAEKVERTGMSDRFSLLSPASLPQAPASPNRMGIGLLGLIFAGSVGTGLAVTREYFDNTVRGTRGVLEHFGAPPIAAVPVILSPAERRQRLWHRMLLGGACLALLLALIYTGIIGAAP